MGTNEEEDRQKRVNRLVKNYKHYQDKLLQITKKNRSILLKRIYNKHNFDLTQLDALKEGVTKKVVAKTLKNIGATLNDRKDEGERQNILLDSITSDDADAARSRLKSLSRNLAQIEEETGQQTGYIGFPFLEGHASPDFYIRGPIVLFPMSLERRRQAKNGGWFLHLADKRPILNGALVAALKKKAGYALPEDYEEAFDEMIENVSNKRENPEDYFFEQVNSWIKAIVPLDETRNQIQITQLETLARDKIEALDCQPLHLVNYVVTGNFPQADNEIYRDYGELIQGAEVPDVGMIGELMDVVDDEAANDISYDSDVTPIDIDGTRDIEMNTVLESDSSQDEVILESKNSDLVVVRGPPGTGKSQVIVNLISDALSGKKRVLVVCQKRAALEVVKQRLGKVGLDRYVVFLEKELDDKVKMYQQLHRIIEEESERRPHPGSDVVKISKKIDSCVQYLSDLGKALRKEYFGGASAHRLYSRADGQYSPILDLASTDIDLGWTDLDDFVRKIQGVEADFRKFENKNHPWFGRKSFDDLGGAEKSGMTRRLEDLANAAPTCTLAGSPEEQSNLLSHFDIYLNKPGFLKMKRRGASKEIGRILGIGAVTEDFVYDNYASVENGVKFWRSFSELLEIFGHEKRKKLCMMVPDTVSLASYISAMQSSLLKEFDAIQEFDKKKKEYGKGIFQILNHAKTRLDDGDWAESIRQEIYSYWLDVIERENPILRGEPISNYQDRKDELARLIDKKRDAVTKKIQHDIKSAINPSEMYGRGRSTRQKKWQALASELKKRRRVKPVRKLFQDYGDTLFQIAPCWLASPESVSKVFPLQRDMFDLVIVDEASQLAVERAIPFLYRTKHAVVAGDEKQLPPFDLFQIREDDLGVEDEDAEIPEEKSLLDLARTRYRTVNLSWHYRSQYQELINFSNHAFYEGLLNVAPNAAGHPAHPPIRWMKCNGTWEGRANHVEASMVADEIRRTWHGSTAEGGGKPPSIGVITFNEGQQALIKDIIEKRRDTDAEFMELYSLAHGKGRRQDDSLFVKNIENVQGDERDVIIFSIGYARDANGNFANRFGTLSMKGGENRLNVAVTRARKEIIVISSIEPADIKLTSRHDGPRRLRQFLEYAKATDSFDEEGQEAVLAELNTDTWRTQGSDVDVFDSEFEIQVCERLREMGHTIRTQVGFSGYRIDLAVIHPDDENRYILGVECDGATFHSSRSVRERDIMRQKFLEGKGWTIERVWSRNWWRNPKREIDRIDARIRALAATSRAEK